MNYETLTLTPGEHVIAMAVEQDYDGRARRVLALANDIGSLPPGLHHTDTVRISAYQCRKLRKYWHLSGILTKSGALRLVNW